MMFGSCIHLVASKIPALQIAVLIILKGLMFGYATDETEECMPLTVALAHRLNARLAALRKDGTFPWAGPDSKTQFMHFIKKVGDGQVDLEQIEKEKQHDAKKISEIWSADFASAWTHTFIILPGDESRSPKQLQMEETVPNSEPMKQITAPFLDSCGDNAVDADDSKLMHFIKKVGDGQVVSPFLFVLNQHAKKIPEIWSADFASAWTRDGDGDMERPPRGSGPRNRLPYRSRKDRRRPHRDRQSRPRADSGAPRGKRDDGDAPNKSDAADDYELKSDEPGNTHENNSDNVNVSPSSNQLSSGSGEPSDSAQTNEGYSNENSSEQERDDFLHKLTSVEDWLYGEGEEEQEAVYK